jgi:vacuolar-type H+-ATPase subunit E/Vma4
VSLQAILKAIRASGESQVSEIEMHAYTQAQEILVDARLEAQQEKEDAFVAASAPAYRERSRTIHRARLEALRITGSVRESLVDAAIEQARGRLQGSRLDTIYPNVLRRLTQTALAELNGSLEGPDKARLSADPRDRTWLASILQDLGLNLQVSYDLDCWGGLIARSEDGRVVVINTLEARLERAIPYLRRTLSAFFEGELAEIMSEQVPEKAPMV